jgi:hypothetical protein
MIEVLQRLTVLLAEKTPDARRIAEQLGTIQSGGEPNVPYKVAPAEKSIREIRVVHNAKTGEPSQVVLVPSEYLSMKTLTATFGEFQKMARLPNPKEPPRVSFHVHPADSQQRIAILASYDAKASEPDSSEVVKVVVLRS